jgi:hypothetical protein
LLVGSGGVFEDCGMDRLHRRCARGRRLPDLKEFPRFSQKSETRRDECKEMAESYVDHKFLLCTRAVAF